jgi:hypothetical protein
LDDKPAIRGMNYCCHFNYLHAFGCHMPHFSALSFSYFLAEEVGDEGGTVPRKPRSGNAGGLYLRAELHSRSLLPRIAAERRQLRGGVYPHFPRITPVGSEFSRKSAASGFPRFPHFSAD